MAHNYGEWSTVTAATCVATGEKSRACSACGHEETEVIAIDPEAHTGVNHTENAEEATCTKAGYTGDTVCECGVIVAAGEEISTVAHNYGEWSIVIEETCMEAGEKSRTCSACGHEETEVIAATGHVDTTETVVNATCTTDGSKTVTCSCGEVVSTETITATGHKGTLVNAQAATCVGSGYNAYYDCANCDMYFTDAECKDAIDDLAAWKTTEGMGYIPAKGHMYNRTWEWTEEGEYTLTLVCSKCETYTKDHKVVKTGTGEVYEKTEPGCETMGTVKYSVSVEVGGRNYENISRIFDLAATGHNKVAIPAVDATCTTAGSTAGVKCSVCGKVLEEPEEVPVAGHDWTEATCVAPKTCKTCGATEGEPAGHSYDEGVITQAPTYATAGIKTVTCTADGCGYSTTENMKVAEVDGVQYEILKDALTSVSDGGTITLLADFADTETITISQAVTINKNGKTATIAAGSGFKATATGDIVTIQKNLWRIYNSNMDLENSLGMIFWVKKANIQEGVDYYALVTKYAEDGSTKQVKIMLSEWQDYSSEYYRFTFDGIAAKEMTDTIEAQVFYAADDTPASRVYTDSVQAYAMYMLEGYTSGPWATLMVDMLNYGAAAQREFGHNLSNLANSQLTATQQKLATQSVTMNDNWEGGALYYNTVLNLENNIILTLLFKDLTSDMYAAISYENFQGELVEYTIPFESFDKRNDNIYAINVDTLVVADGRQVVSCEIYNGAHQPVGSCKDSIEGYLSVMKGNDPNGLYVATMKFIDSACVAFKPK